LWLRSVNYLLKTIIIIIIIILHIVVQFQVDILQWYLDKSSHRSLALVLREKKKGTQF